MHKHFQHVVPLNLLHNVHAVLDGAEHHMLQVRQRTSAPRKAMHWQHAQGHHVGSMKIPLPQNLPYLAIEPRCLHGREEELQGKSKVSEDCMKLWQGTHTAAEGR